MSYKVEVRNSSGDLVGRVKDLLSGSMEESLNAPAQLDFSVPVDDQNSADITNTNEYWLRDSNFIEVKNKFRFLSRIDERDKGSIVEARCLSLISQLDGELVVDYDTGDAGKTITQIVTDLLALQVSANPITIGTIEPTVTRAVRVQGDSILRALWRLRDTVGGYISVNNARQLDWLNDVGEDKGQQIRYRKNLKGITREADYSEVVNKLYPYGAGETDARIKLSDILVSDEEATKDSDATYGYLYLGGLYSCYKDWTGAGDALPAEMVVKKNGVDNSGVWSQGADEQTLRCAIGDFDPAATYTITYRHADFLWDGSANPVPRQKVDHSITHPDTLLAWARLILGEYKDPRYTYEVDIIDLAERDPEFEFDRLQLGSTVKVIDEELDIDISARIVKIRHPDLLNPEEVEIEIANRVKDITDVLTEVYDTQQLEQHIATEIGAGQVIVKGVFTVADWVTPGATTIQGGNIEADTITATQLIKTENVITQTIQVANGIITSAKIDNLEVKTANIDNLAITTGKINNLAVTTGKIDDLAVTTAKIGNLQVTEGKIANLAVTTGKIDDLAVTNAKINDLAVDKLTVGNLTVAVTTSGSGKVRSGSGNARVELSTAGIKGYDSGGVQRVQILNDGSGWLGSSGSLSWTAGGVLTVAAARVSGALTAATISASNITTGNLTVTLTVTTGAISVAGGGVLLDSSGITLKGNMAKFKSSGGTTYGYIWPVSNEFVVQSVSTHLVLQAPGTYGVKVYGLDMYMYCPINAQGVYTNYLYDIRPYNTTSWIGYPSSSYIWQRGYFSQLGDGSYKVTYLYRTNEYSCPLPTSNSALAVVRKIKKPAIADGDYGTRHYFTTQDFPEEMKNRPVIVDKEGKATEAEPDIELTRVTGVLVEAVRELTADVDILKNEVVALKKP